MTGGIENDRLHECVPLASENTSVPESEMIEMSGGIFSPSPYGWLIRYKGKYLLSSISIVEERAWRHSRTSAS